MYQGADWAKPPNAADLLRDTEDGFKIAEEDLRLRGPARCWAPAKAAYAEFRLADLARDKDLLDIAHSDAKVILLPRPGIGLRTREGFADSVVFVQP